MSHKNDGLSFERSANAVIENVLTNVTIYCAQRIVQQIDIPSQNRVLRIFYTTVKILLFYEMIRMFTCLRREPERWRLAVFVLLKG